MATEDQTRTFDIQLDSDDTASPTTSASFMLAEDKEGKKMWAEKRLPMFPTRISEGPIGYAHYDPQRDLIWSQSDWSDGGLKPVWTNKNPNTYAVSNGCDLRWKNTATLGMKRENTVGFVLRNPGAESGVTTGWTQNNGTLTTPAGAARTGSYGFRDVTGGALAADTSLFSQSFTNPTVWRSRQVRVVAYIRRTSGAESGAYLRIEDSAGNAANSSTITSSTYSYVTAQLTVGAAATSVTVRIRSSALETGAHTYEADDFAIFPTGGVACAGVAELSNALYGAFGRVVALWDETNDVWDAVYVHASVVASSIVEFNGSMVVAFGLSNAYIYGSSTTWTARSTGTTTFQFFTVSRNSIWGNSTASAVRSNTDPTEPGAAWSSAYTVGSTNRAITGLFNFNDTVQVGKQDGMHVYLRAYADGSVADLFVNATNQFRNFTSNENFQIAYEHMGWLYITALQQSLFRYNGNVIENISSLLISPRLPQFGGRVRAMAADPVQLYLLVDYPTADTTTTKTVTLLSLRETIEGFKVHPLESITVGVIDWMESWYDRTSATNIGYLWAFARVYDSTLADYLPAFYRWLLPTKTVAPAYDLSPNINLSGNFDTSTWDAEMPTEDKAFVALTIFTKPSTLDANHTIVAKFGTDGAASTTTTLGTFSGSGAIQTKFFDTITTPESNAIGKALQLNYAMSTNNTVSPELYAFTLHATLRPQRVKTWELYIQVGDGVQLANGAVDPEGKIDKLNKLSTLETQVYPIELEEDLNNDGAVTKTRVQIVPGTLERVPIEERKFGVEVYKLYVQEVALA